MASLVLLTGPGKLGRPLAARLAAAGFDGRLLSRRPVSSSGSSAGSSGLPPGWTGVAGDVTRPETLAAPLAGVDAVLHLAAITHSADEAAYDRTNRSGTANVLAAAAAAGASRFVHVSTRAIDPAGGAYSRSKAAAEGHVTASALAWTIVRPAEVYGAGGGEGIDRLIATVRKGPLVPVVAARTARVAPLYLDDAIEGIAQALLRDAAIGRVYTLGGPEEMTYGELVARLARHYGLRRLQLRVPIVLVALAARAMRRLGGLGLGRAAPIVPDQIPRLLVAKSADIGPARADLGFDPRRLEAGLAAMDSPALGAEVRRR